MRGYRDVATDIRRRIEAGEFPPGSKLPTIDQLREQYGNARQTIRAALAALANEGLVTITKGQGTEVRQLPRARRHGIDRYAKSVWKRAGKSILTAEAEGQGHVANQDVRALEAVPAPAVVASRLGVLEGTPVWVRRRTTKIDGRPNQLADSYYELSVVEGTRIMEVNTGPGGGFARLEDAGHELAHLREEFSARMPTSDEVKLLSLMPATPVIDLIRTTYTTSGRAVEVMVAVLAGDMNRFDYTFPFPD
jgi:GntR family transcriptional regulator